MVSYKSRSLTTTWGSCDTFTMFVCLRWVLIWRPKILFPYKMTNSVSIGNGKSVSEDIFQQSEKRETQNDDVFDESYGDKRITNAIKHLFVKRIVLFTVWNVSDVCHHVFQLSNVYLKKFLCSFSSWISNANSHLALFSFPVISVKNHKQSLTMATRIVSANSSSAKLSFSFVKSTR